MEKCRVHNRLLLKKREDSGEDSKPLMIEIKEKTKKIVKREEVKQLVERKTAVYFVFWLVISNHIKIHITNKTFIKID